MIRSHAPRHPGCSLISRSDEVPRARGWAAAALLAGTLAAAAPAMAADGSKPPSEHGEIAALRRELSALAKQVEQVARQNRLLIEQNEALAARERALEARVGRPSPEQPPVPPSPTSPAGASSTGTPAVAGGSAPARGSASSSLLPPTAAPAPEGGGVPAGLANTSLWGYGEVYYADPLKPGTRAEADLARAVFGIGHEFGPSTEFNSEFEVEHAVASAVDKGEFEVEQFYIDQRLADPVTLRAGLFLMPFGFLNEHHEPTNFYGMQRNFIETLIIPSTWREGGFNLHGETPGGFGWNVGLTTGFNLSGWDFTPEFPLYTTALDLETSGAAPLQATHQELSEADAHSLSQYVALSYFGVPGLTVAGAIFTGEAAPVPEPPNAPPAGSQRVTLWEGHARWAPGRWDLSALYAHGAISHLGLINAAVPGSPNPIPSAFYGYYFQAAYDLWQHGGVRLAPFARWEYYDLGASFEGTPGPDVPPGLVPLSAAPGDYGYWPRNRDRVGTAGVNLYLTPGVVLKADYQRFLINAAFTRVDLGLGVSF